MNETKNSQMEHDELVSRISGLTIAEKRIVLEAIPLELIEDYVDHKKAEAMASIYRKYQEACAELEALKEREPHEPGQFE